MTTLITAGFDSCMIDFRRNAANYYLPSGESFELSTHMINVPIPTIFDNTRMKEAILEAQQSVDGYTYMSFCKKVAKAGCAGYLVSFSGQRVLYFGRNADTHVEYFRQSVIVIFRDT